MTCTIRPAVKADTATILHFIRELAIYEKAEHEAKATEEHIHRTLFNEQPKAHAIICELNGEAIGFAVYFFSYSTWQGQYGIYLEDLYVSSAHRGVGAGKQLLTALPKLPSTMTAAVLNGACWIGISPRLIFTNHWALSHRVNG